MDKALSYLSFGNDNLFISYLENKTLNEDISFRFKFQNCYERYLKDEFENYREKKA